MEWQGILKGCGIPGILGKNVERLVVLAVPILIVIID